MMQFQQVIRIAWILAAQSWVTLAVEEGCAKDIVFLADISGSVSANKEIAQLKGFMIDLVGRFKIGNVGGSKVSMVTFETTASKVLDLNGNKQTIIDNINGISASSGWTNYISAIEIAKEILNGEGDRDDSIYPDVIVMLTDGKPTRTKNNTGVPDNSFTEQDVKLRAQMHADILSLCGQLVRDKVTIITIAISDETNTTLLNLMSSSGRSFKEQNNQDSAFNFAVDNFDALVNLSDSKKEQIVKLMCASGAEIVPTGPDCFDVTFLVDISGSVSGQPGDKIATIKQYLHTIVDNANIGSAAYQTRISIITFERRATKIASFQNSKSEVKQAINSISSTSGWTNYFEAFYLANQIYGSSTDRADNFNPDLVVLLTDGKPTVTRNDQTLSEHDFSLQGNKTREQMHKDILSEVKSLVGHSSLGRLAVLCQAIGDQVNRTLLELIDNSNIGQDFPPLKVHQTDFYSDATKYAMVVVEFMKEECAKLGRDPVDCLDITFMMDMSGSIMYLHDESIAKRELGDAFRSVLNNYPAQLYSLVEFSDNAEVVFELSTRTESSIRAEIEAKVNRGGWTATAKAFQVVRNQVYRGFSPDRSRGQNVVIILTDGHPTRSLNLTLIRETESRERRRYIEDEAINEARQLRSQDNAIICAVLVDGKHNQNRDFLLQVISRSDYIETIDNFDQAGSAINRLMNKIPIVRVEDCS